MTIFKSQGTPWETLPASTQNSVVNSALPITIVKQLIALTNATATTQKLYNSFHPELVDAVLGLELFRLRKKTSSEY